MPKISLKETDRLLNYEKDIERFDPIKKDTTSHLTEEEIIRKKKLNHRNKKRADR